SEICRACPGTITVLSRFSIRVWPIRHIKAEGRHARAFQDIMIRYAIDRAHDCDIGTLSLHWLEMTMIQSDGMRISCQFYRAIIISGWCKTLKGKPTDTICFVKK